MGYLSHILQINLVKSPLFIPHTRGRGARYRLRTNRHATNMPPTSGNSVTPKKFNPFPFHYHQELIIRIDDLNNLGVGIGRQTLQDGKKWVIMTPLTLPGEEVLVRIYRNFPNYSEADLLQVLKPSAQRIEPQCKYFSTCGGCQYQMMTIESQREWKRNQVVSLLSRLGGLSTISVNPVIGTEEVFFYRMKITPHYGAPRGDAEISVGFQKRGSRQIVDIDQCLIATKAINAKYASVRETLSSQLREKKSKKGATLLFREADSGHVESDFRQIITQTVNEVEFQFKAGEFFQNNAYVLPLMVNHVVEQARGRECEYLIDAYCGAGLFSLCSAPYFVQVYGIEISQLSIDAASRNAKINGIENAKFLCGSSEKIFGSAQVQALPRDKTVIIVDPPRKGCDHVFLDQLFAFRPRKIVYMSCDPATQARDCRIITTAGYTVTDVTPFDLFPQTRHIENCMTFERCDHHRTHNTMSTMIGQQ